MNPTSSTGPTTSSVRYSAIHLTLLVVGPVLLDPPQVVETVFDFLDRAQQCPGEQGEADGAYDTAADAVGELHDALRELVCSLLAHGPEEFVHDGLQVTVCAEHLQDGETEGHQRNQR
jgi:hypothetical protein